MLNWIKYKYSIICHLICLLITESYGPLDWRENERIEEWKEIQTVILQNPSALVLTPILSHTLLALPLSSLLRDARMVFASLNGTKLFPAWSRNWIESQSTPEGRMSIEREREKERARGLWPIWLLVAGLHIIIKLETERQLRFVKKIKHLE